MCLGSLIQLSLFEEFQQTLGGRI